MTPANERNENTQMTAGPDAPRNRKPSASNSTCPERASKMSKTQKADTAAIGIPTTARTCSTIMVRKRSGSCKKCHTTRQSAAKLASVIPATAAHVANDFRAVLVDPFSSDLTRCLLLGSLVVTFGFAYSKAR